MQELYWVLACVFCLSLGWQAGKHGEQYWSIAKQAGQMQANKIFPPKNEEGKQ